MEMRWSFINKPTEKLLGVKRRDMVGKHCSNWGANICKTAHCGIAQLRGNCPRTTFKQQGMDLQVDTSYLLNTKGERIGHVEAVQEITALVRVGEHQEGEAQSLADGDLAVSVAAARRRW